MKTKLRIPQLLVVSFLAISSVTSLQAAVLFSSTTQDASPYFATAVGFPPALTLPQDGGSGVNAGGTTLQTANSSNQLGNAVFSFQLPNLGAVANPFLTGVFTATLSGSSGGSAFNFNPGGNNYDLYGLGVRSTGSVLATDFYAGSTDSTDATLVAASFPGVDFTFNSYIAGASFSTTGISLVDYLNAQYNSGAGAGQFVFLRINPNFNPSSFTDLSWFSGASSSDVPMINYTTAVPEPSQWALLIMGGLMIAMRSRRRLPVSLASDR